MNRLAVLPKIKFLAYDPALRPQKDGGFVLVLQVPETEWEAVKDLNNPALKNKVFIIKIEEENNSSK